MVLEIPVAITCWEYLALFRGCTLLALYEYPVAPACMCLYLINISISTTLILFSLKVLAEKCSFHASKCSVEHSVPPSVHTHLFDNYGVQCDQTLCLLFLCATDLGWNPPICPCAGAHSRTGGDCLTPVVLLSEVCSQQMPLQVIPQWSPLIASAPLVLSYYTCNDDLLVRCLPMFLPLFTVCC